MSHRRVGLAVLAVLQGFGCQGEDATTFPSGVAAPGGAPADAPGEAPSDAESAPAEHEERANLSADGDPAALADAANWRFWMLDLDTRAANPIDAIGYHAGGFATSRIDGRTFLMVPSADYESTSVYELAPGGAAELRWSVPGWTTELYPLR